VKRLHAYQQLFPEVKHLVDEFLNDDTSKEIESITKRIEPFIRIKGSKKL